MGVFIDHCPPANAIVDVLLPYKFYGANDLCSVLNRSAAQVPVNFGVRIKRKKTFHIRWKEFSKDKSFGFSKDLHNEKETLLQTKLII